MQQSIESVVDCTYFISCEQNIYIFAAVGSPKFSNDVHIDVCIVPYNDNSCRPQTNPPPACSAYRRTPIPMGPHFKGSLALSFGFHCMTLSVSTSCTTIFSLQSVDEVVERSVNPIAKHVHWHGQASSRSLNLDSFSPNGTWMESNRLTLNYLFSLQLLLKSLTSMDAEIGECQVHHISRTAQVMDCQFSLISCSAQVVE